VSGREPQDPKWEFLTPAVDERQHLQDHAKLIYVPGWHQPETVFELLINQDRWNALDDREQTVLDTACRAMLLATLAESPRLQNKALADLAKDGVRVETCQTT
jgi:TRAP-type mannitol/chloroaromatic compound transport system substrate-binding protein